MVRLARLFRYDPGECGSAAADVYWFLSSSRRGKLYSLGIQIGLRIRNELLHRLQILAELLNTLVPSSGTRWSIRFRPIILRPFGRLVFGVAAEFENIPLRQPKMLEQHPGRVRESVGFYAAQLLRHVFHDVVKPGVGAAAVKQINDVLAKLLAVRIFDGHLSFPMLQESDVQCLQQRFIFGITYGKPEGAP